MDRYQKPVVIAGLALIVGGLLFGLIFAYFVDHQARLVAADSYQPVFELLGENSATDWRALQEKINAQSLTHASAINFHAHSINMGVLLILVGLLVPLLGRAQGSGVALVVGFIVAACLYPAGLLLIALNFAVLGEIVATLGAVLAIAVFALLYLNFSKALKSVPK
jgi:hypothetical protein